MADGVSFASENGPLTSTEEKGIRFVVKHLADKGVVDLERIATALYVSLESPLLTDVNQRAQRLNELKPHVSIQDAAEAVRLVDGMRSEVAKL